ncbi:MAG: tetratricopeptide repeat protein [Verrucomicrobiales bacterium]
MLHLRFIPLLLTSLWLLAWPAGASGGESANYERGVAAFEKKDWPAAREAFEAVIESDQQISNDLSFNLGNTLFREDKLGGAALWYRRALLLDPRDAAARQNLRLIQRRTGSLEFAVGPGRTVASWLKHTQWRWMLVASAWTGVLALAALGCLRLRGTARGWAWTLVALAVPAAGLAAWGMNARLDPGEASRRAVVTQVGVTALSAPTDTAGVIIDLPPGSEVVTGEARETWTYVEIPGTTARVGWVRSQSLSPLWPYSPELIQ